MQLQHGALLGESAKGQNNERQTRAERDASHLAGLSAKVTMCS